MRRKPTPLMSYGIRPYAGAKGLAAQRRMFTGKQQHDGVADHPYSVFKRPFGGGYDNYPSMEYWGDYPPGIFPYGPFLPDIPGLKMPVPNWEVLGDPWSVTFFCGGDPCWCDGETKTFPMGCTYEITGAYFSPPEADFSAKAGKNSVSITAVSGARGVGLLTVEMKARVPAGGEKYKFVTGAHSGIVVGECKADVCCDATITAYDSGSDDTIVRSGTATVAVTGSGNSIDWTISGTGFYFDAGFSVTSLTAVGTSVTVYADNTACGSATITATACDDTTATGYLREQGNSEWSAISWACPIPGAQTGANERIEGKYKVTQTFQTCQGFTGPDTCGTVDCTTRGACSGDDFTECLEWDCDDAGLTDFIECGSWCCSGSLDGCGGPSGGCVSVSSKTLYEWVCS